MRVPIFSVSLAVWQRMTVMKGQTVNLRCPVTNNHQTDLDWKNPEGYVMFFNNKRGEGEDLSCPSTTPTCRNISTNCLMFEPKFQESLGDLNERY